MQHHISITTGSGGHGIGGGTGGRAGDVHFHDDRSALLMALPHALYAGHDSVREDAPSPCLEGTRVAVLEEILTWLESPNGERPPVYWLNGLAGIGKSTIAKTVADQAQEKGMLGATFFFSRSDKPLRDPGLVLPTLAFQLAQGLLSQLQGLILTPLLTINPHRSPIIFILDALDECEEKGAAEILQFMFAHVARIPFLRILITSRPQPHISSIFNKVPNLAKTVLHDIEASVVEQDIYLYISSELAKIPRKLDLAMPTDWVTEAEKNFLVKKSGKLFIYAATAIRFIGDDRVQDPQMHLALILNTQSLREAGATPYAQLDKLYMEVLRNSLSSSNHGEILRRFQIVVGSIVLLREPLPLRSLAEFVQYETRVVETSLRHLHSVIVPPSNTHEAPRIYHPSFLEFITDASRCSMPEFVIVAVPEQELRHAIRCFELMAKHLKQDVAGISDPSLLNRDVEGFEEKVREALSPEVQYACQYWTSHLSRVEVGEARIMEALEAFLMRSILWWFEAMSLLGSVSNAVSLIEEAHHWANISKSKVIVVTILSDSRRFILAHGEVIRASALHVYHSALPFTPHNTALYKTYCGDGKDSVKVLKGVESEWPQNLSTLCGHSGWVTTIAFSPNGLLLASGSDDTTVQLWDPISGVSIALLVGHSDEVNTIAFSPDGLHLASGSSDHTVQLWDPVSHASIATLEGHSNCVRSIAFSPDGLCLASGSLDHTVQLWNPTSGVSIAKLDGHSGPVRMVAFSPDGLYLASGSDDHTVQLWDPISTASLRSLKGHSDVVNAIAFSPNGWLASGSCDHTVQLWDPISGASIAKLEGHSDVVTTVAFSPDGLCLASGSEDYTVQLWDPISGVSIAKLEGHFGEVNTIAFSPDGLCLASGSSDYTVQLWDPISGASIATLESHSDVVHIIAFSPDGVHLASGSNDGSVRLWNPVSSTSLTEPQDHGGSVKCIAFSPDGLYLASSGTSAIVCLWNPISGASIATLEGHSRTVRTLAFSPNGWCLASGSDDHTVQLWDPMSGTSMAKLEGHSDRVTSLAFSPDGLCLASASADHTVQLWDPRSGISIAKLEGHSSKVKTVAFSPDGLRLASGSYDHTVRLWDPTFGASIAQLEGHYGTVSTIAFSPDGLYLASGSWDHIQLSDPISGASIAKLEGHSGIVHNLQFSPDAHTLVSNSKMKTIIWDLTSQPPYHPASRSSLATPAHFVGMTPPIWSLQGRWIQGIQQEEHYARKICYIPPHHFLNTKIVASSQPTYYLLAVGCDDGHVIIHVPHHLFPQHFIEDPVNTWLIPTVATLPNHDTLLMNNDSPSMYGAPSHKK
ncbi:hypothetical protein BS47DRAFT_1488334 [Hydnum rufescens UP504]|uniref:Nephrocystin 3-like N-terminal domain-containing protein n=1 Tax=Hydnum rufescens UP504 TaxID=1448309 RepID=A0A9P6DRL6_9AGAM|nr:hypothetical protein BS47DRAFT_1488334 [Hydnum rufescens UP504]